MDISKYISENAKMFSESALKNSRWHPGTSFGGKIAFPSRSLSEPLLLICTVHMTLFLDAWMTRLIQSTSSKKFCRTSLILNVNNSYDIPIIK